MKLILSDTQIDVDINDKEDVRYFDLSKMKISNCTGCFGCWIKTPGKCVIRDDAVRIYPLIAASSDVMYVSRVKYGGYDAVLKTMLERAIPVQQAFIRIVDGETHHVQRDVKLKNAKIIAYGEIDDEEKELFKSLVARNAKNMNFEKYEVIFTSKGNLNETIKAEVEKWRKQ